MKKIYVVCFCSILALWLCACGQSKESIDYSTVASIAEEDPNAPESEIKSTVEENSDETMSSNDITTLTEKEPLTDLLKQSSKPDSNDFNQKTNVQDSLGTFSFYIPENWDKQFDSSYAESNFLQRYYVNGETSTFLQMTIDNGPYQDITTPEMSSSFIDGYLSGFEDVTNLNQYTTTVAGYNSLIFSFSAIVDGSAINMTTAVFTDDKYSLVSLGFLADDTVEFDYTNDFLLILESVVDNSLEYKEQIQEVVDSLNEIYSNQDGVIANISTLTDVFTKQTVIDLRIYFDSALYSSSDFQNIVCDVLENISVVSGEITLNFNACHISIVENIDNLSASILSWDSRDDDDLSIGTIHDYYNDHTGYNVSSYQINDWFVDSANDPTTGEKNALSKAKDYLAFTAFSYSGLIDQLEYEGFTKEEATYGADNCGADWNEQAAKKAADYLDFRSFSRDELIDQLEYEGFTYDQAVYGVEANGY